MHWSDLLRRPMQSMLQLPWMPPDEQRMPLDPVRLPRDERPHRTQVEWWHFMGYVEPRPAVPRGKKEDDQEREARRRRRTTFVMSVLKGQIQQISQLASIVILFDHERKTYSTSAKFGTMQSSYFELQDGRAFRFHFGPSGPAREGPPEAWSVAGGMGMYTMAIDTVQQLALELHQRAPAVFPGPGGIFHYGGPEEDQPPREMAYYLWPLLQVDGIRGIGADERAVQGEAWMEHQWGDVPLGQYRWRYLAVVIEEGDFKGRWLFFSTQARSGRGFTRAGDHRKHWTGFWITPDGRHRAVSADEPAPAAMYDVYPLVTHLRVRLESEAPAFGLRIEPLHRHQECRTNLPAGLLPAFWEGACDVHLSTPGMKEQRVGWAIMELAGFR